MFFPVCTICVNNSSRKYLSKKKIKQGANSLCANGFGKSDARSNLLVFFTALRFVDKMSIWLYYKKYFIIDVEYKLNNRQGEKP